MNILHLAFNYPDEITPRTTFAIKRFIESTSLFSASHCVSMHNGFPKFNEKIKYYSDHTVIMVWGLPYYFFSRDFLRRCLNAIHRSQLSLAQFDVIHAHRLTYEGVIASKMSQALKIPYFISIRATDFVLFTYKPYLRTMYFGILIGAQRIGIISPWMLIRLRTVFGNAWTEEIEQKVVLLGNVVSGVARQCQNHNNHYVMPFAINNSQLKRKNIYRTLDAISLLASKGKNIQLDIIGSGTGIEKVAKEIKKRNLDSQVHLIGQVPHEKMIDKLSNYKALLLCSYPETFGLVYIEALFSGIPLIFANDTGMDGWFKAYNIGPSVSATSVESIAVGIDKMEDNYEIYKQEVGRLQLDQKLNDFGAEVFALRLRDEFYNLH